RTGRPAGLRTGPGEGRVAPRDAALRQLTGDAHRPLRGAPASRTLEPLAGGFRQLRMLARREAQGTRFGRADRLEVDRASAIEARDPVPQHAPREHERVDEPL